MGDSDRLEAWRARLTPTNACLLLAGMLTLASPADAAVFGEVMAISAIGEPLRAEIRSLSRTTPPPTCLRVASRPAPSNTIPTVRNARVDVVGEGATARIIVSTDTPMAEPVLRLTLENICDAQLQREYMLLLPPPPELAVTPPLRPPTTASTPSPPASADTPTWIAAPGESASTIAQALYPDDPGARRAFIAAVVQNNPQLFRDGIRADSALPAGTQFRVPPPARIAVAASRVRSDQVRPPAPRPAAATQDPATSTQDFATSPQQEPTAGHLRVQADTDPADDRLPVSVRPNIRDTAPHSDEQMQLREEYLVAAVDRTIEMQLELTERIRRLEEIQVGLKALIEASDPLLETAPQKTDTAATAGDAIPEREAAQPPVPQRDWVLWALLLGTLGAAAGAIALRRRRSSAERSATLSDEWPPGKPLGTSRPDEHTHSPTYASSPGAATPVAAVAAAATTTDKHNYGDSPPQLPSLAPVVVEEEIVEEHDSAVELAEIMMSFGRVQGAAETLAEFIRSNPKRAITPWLKLMDVYRLGEMREEFDTLAQQLNKTFNVQAVTWDNYEEARKSTNSLEQMPHIVKLLLNTWGTRECQTYLETILRDNRDGTRQGFALSIIDEIVMLAGVLEQQLGRCQVEIDP